LLFTAKGEKCPVYAITSADTHEGKSLNSVNLSLSYAQLGKRVLLIDADMRKSNLRKLLKLEEGEGLSHYLAGITDELCPEEISQNFFVVPCGDFPPNPAELLSSDRWHKLLEQSKEEYDVIFVDLPPVGIVSDALTMAKTATAYILVVKERVTKFDREQMIVQQLEPLGANICGFIYNGISMKSQDYNYKYYGRNYEN
jgi:capsular exopolysaccharide synthesis family protein